MSRRARLLRYGASIAVALAGVACGVIIPGSAGGTAATVLVGIGLVGVVSLIFYEVGLTEDRERARRQAPGERIARESPQPGERIARESPQPGERIARESPQPGERIERAPSSPDHGTPGEHQGGRIRPLERRRGQRRRLR